jgi:hypothetical protein
LKRKKSPTTERVVGLERENRTSLCHAGFVVICFQSGRSLPDRSSLIRSISRTTLLRLRHLRSAAKALRCNALPAADEAIDPPKNTPKATR